MRTTLDLPDELHRRLKMRAGLEGVSLKDVLKQVIEAGLARPSTRRAMRHEAPPVAIPMGTDAIRIAPEQMRQQEVDEDLERLRRSGWNV